MRLPSRFGLVVLSAMVLTAVVGCPDTRTSNQGGGSLITVAITLLSDPNCMPIGNLNADELQILVDNLSLLTWQLGYSLSPNITIPSLTDEQAQAIADFLDDNGIVCVAELENLAANVESGEVEMPDGLVEVLEALGMPLV